MNCDQLVKADISNDCSAVHTKGYKALGKLINYDDIDWANVAYNTGKTNSVKTLPLLSGKTGYDVVQLGNQPFTGTKVDMVEGTYRNTFTNTCSFVVLDNDPDMAEDIIDGLASGKFVLILQSLDMGDSTNKDGAFRIFGMVNGLHATALANDAYSDAFNGWVVTLVEENNPNSAMFLFDTSYATTLTAFNAY